MTETTMTPPPATTPGVEWKVLAATIATYVGSLALTIVVQALQDGSLIAVLPGPASAILAPFVPAAITFITGYLAKHTPRQGDIQAAVNSAVSDAITQLTGVVRAEVTAALSAIESGKVNGL